MRQWWSTGLLLELVTMMLVFGFLDHKSLVEDQAPIIMLLYPHLLSILPQRVLNLL